MESGKSPSLLASNASAGPLALVATYSPQARRWRVWDLEMGLVNSIVKVQGDREDLTASDDVIW